MVKDQASKARAEVIKMKLKLAKTAAKSAKISRRKAKRDSAAGYHGLADRHVSSALASELEAINRYEEVAKLFVLSNMSSNVE